MYYIKRGRVVWSSNGRSFPTTCRTIMRFDNNHIFDFDITKPEEWRRFLSEYRKPDGKKLARKTVDGDPVFYSVILYGTTIWQRELFGVGSPIIICFPDVKYKRKGVSITTEYGRLDD